jgi:hypothetical protein
VIGGLLFATVSTLFFVPLVFAGIHTRLARRHRDDDDTDTTGGHGNDGPAPDHGGAGKPA